MRSRTFLSSTARSAERLPAPLSSSIAATIVAVRPASERGRAESIRDVVDAYRRLYGSVQRFVLMFAEAPLNFASVGTSGSPSLNQLLSILTEQAQAAAFARLRDLKTAVEEARSAEQMRDAIFSDALSNDLAALRKVVAELERLDTVFIGLCVGHVLEQHANGAAAPAAGKVANADASVSSKAKRSPSRRGAVARNEAKPAVTSSSSASAVKRRAARAQAVLAATGD